jgi:sugar/nucleoside kinase (ribokinase family)
MRCINDIVTFFDANVDLIVDVNNIEIEYDQKERIINDYSLRLGGSACIFACQCAKLGMRVSGIGVVGDDIFGKLVVNELQKANVKTDGICIDASLNTGISIALSRKNDRAILTVPGTFSAVTYDKIPDDFLKGAKHLHIASYYLLTGLKESMPMIVQEAKKLGLTVSLDTNWDPSEKWELPSSIMDSIDIFFPNENEIKFLTRKQTIEEAVKHYSSVPIIVVKQGKAGATVFTKQETIHLPAIPVAVKDTVGAGDSFDAGFLYGFLNNYSMEKCLAAGIYCGTSVVKDFGGVNSQTSYLQLEGYLNK